MCFLLWMIYAWLPDYLRSKFRLDLAGSGLHATLTLQVASACGLLSGGWLGDRLVRVRAQGRCYVVAAGLLVAAPLAPAIFAAPTIPLMQLAAAGFGFFSGLMLSNVVAGAYQMVPPQRYGLTAGCLTLAGGLAGGIGTLLGGLLDRSVGLSQPVEWFSGVCALCAVLLAIVARRKAIPVQVN
ncbi:MAG TPA: MFS transporter [Gemmatimonadales bacterium]|nr:MFS transporter [Gemmatimonadales bacterium]